MAVSTEGCEWHCAQLSRACAVSAIMLANHRLQRLARHLRPSLVADESEADELRLISWDEIQRHQMIEDAWVVIDGTVYDITEFIKEDSGHPGGADIPMEYAGKDATEFWTDMQCEQQPAAHSRATAILRPLSPRPHHRPAAATG